MGRQESGFMAHFTACFQPLTASCRRLCSVTRADRARAQSPFCMSVQFGASHNQWCFISEKLDGSQYGRVVADSLKMTSVEPRFHAGGSRAVFTLAWTYRC